jgi:hypothetical protein
MMSMAQRATIPSLVRGTLYRRGAHLLLGGAIALPYVWLALAFARLLTYPQAPTAAVLLLLAAALTAVLVPPFLHATRSLEILAARLLLDVELRPRPTRRRPAWRPGSARRCGSGCT